MSGVANPAMPGDDLLAEAEVEPPITLIAPRRAKEPSVLHDLWQARELILFLAWRDVRVRYRQTLLGVSWALLQPLMMMIVFSIVFGRVAGLSHGSLPYPLLAYTGLAPWSFFATAVAASGSSVIHSERLVTKVYFCRLAIPIATVVAGVVDFAVASLLLGILMAYHRVAPGAGLFLAPPIFATIFVGAAGVGTALAALNVSYRDFRYIIPFAIQLWLFATPAVYLPGVERISMPGKTQVAAGAEGLRDPGDYRPGGPERTAEEQLGRWTSTFFALNPLNHLIAAFRASLLGGAIPWAGLGASAVAAIATFILACTFFRGVEDRFADII